MAVNHFKGKYHEGTFANGEGPVLGQTILGQTISHEAESKGVLGTDDGTGHHLSTVGGKGELLAGTPNDKNFDLHSSTYAGPENWQPKNEGESHPHDVK